MIARCTLASLPLALAVAQAGWEEGAQMLLDCGSDPNQVSFPGSTPILFAVKVRGAQQGMLRTGWLLTPLPRSTTLGVARV